MLMDSYLKFNSKQINDFKQPATAIPSMSVFFLLIKMYCNAKGISSDIDISGSNLNVYNELLKDLAGHCSLHKVQFIEDINRKPLTDVLNFLGGSDQNKLYKDFINYDIIQKQWSPITEHKFGHSTSSLDNVENAFLRGLNSELEIDSSIKNFLNQPKNQIKIDSGIDTTELLKMINYDKSNSVLLNSSLDANPNALDFKNRMIIFENNALDSNIEEEKFMSEHNQLIQSKNIKTSRFN
jgi:hypothetical protein